MQMSELISLSPSDYPRFYEMALEYEQSGDGRYIKYTPIDNFMKFLSAIEDYQFEENCPDHIVPETWYWLENSGNLIGAIRYRHRLNSNLIIEGGHIGYDIRPSERQKGYGYEILDLLLNELKHQKITRVLITCFEDNVASEKIILKSGGVLESIEASPRNGEMAKRFWIDL
jgi:predicted acetyltransferase